MSFAPSRRTVIAGGGLAGAAGIARAAGSSGAQEPTSPSSHPEPSILDWGARGNNDPADAERIQRAFDEAPIGGTLRFPPGDFRTRQPLRLRRHLNLIGSGGTRLTGEFDPKSDAALLDVNVEDPVNRDNRNQRIQGLRMWLISGQGDGLAFRNRAPNIANIGLIIENNLIAGTGAGYAIRLEGIGTHHLTVRNNQIIEGVYVASADGVTIEECLIWGDKPGVTLDLIPGAFQTRVLRNAIVARDGALRLLNGSQVYFEYNQVEQPPRRNASPEGAHVAITPRGYGSRHVRIRSNNFGAGDNARLSIYAAGDCRDLLIDDNVFNLTSTGVDVELADAAVAWTRVGSTNATRRSGVARRPDGDGGAISVRDNGVGTFGVRRPVPPPEQGATPLLFVVKSLDGTVRFSGATPAPRTAGVRLGTLPSGFRPQATLHLPLATDRGATAVVRIGADGAITSTGAADGAPSWAGVSFAAAPAPAHPTTDP